MKNSRRHLWPVFLFGKGVNKVKKCRVKTAEFVGGIFLASLLLSFVIFASGKLYRDFVGISSQGVLGKGGMSHGDCTTIQSGELLTSDGRVIDPGYDEWGYNYQAYMFNGMYCDAYRDAAWCQPYKDIDLIMKWNDAWLSNKDCDGDRLLDRHYGFDSYIGSGAWLTNHQSGSYEGEDSEVCRWNYFVKIVAAPADASSVDGMWYAADGTAIGPVIWGEFAIIQQIDNDPCAGLHGASYISPVGPGFGKF